MRQTTNSLQLEFQKPRNGVCEFYATIVSARWRDRAGKSTTCRNDPCANRAAGSGPRVRISYLPPLQILKDAARRALSPRPILKFKVNNAGWTNLMLEVNGQWMFRFPRWPESARGLGFEVRLLEYLDRHLSVPIPKPFLVGTLAKPSGWPFMAYRRLPGAPLNQMSRLRRRDRARLLRFLIGLFSELAALPATQIRRLGAREGGKESWTARFEVLERRYERTGSNRVPAEIGREITRQFDLFYSTIRRSSYRPVLLHNDLWPNHILWDSATHRPTGVIDWEDSRFGDPAFDLTTLDEIGRDFMEKLMAVRRAPRDDLFEERLLFYRRILPLQGYLFGLETGKTALARVHLRRLRTTLAAGHGSNTFLIPGVQRRLHA